MFLDLIDVALVNSHIIYTVMTSLLNYNFFLAKALIGRYSSRKKSFPTSRLRKVKPHEPSMPREVPINVPEFQETRITKRLCPVRQIARTYA